VTLRTLRKRNSTSRANQHHHAECRQHHPSELESRHHFNSSIQLNKCAHYIW
jgi:hypothetical protein